LFSSFSLTPLSLVSRQHKQNESKALYHSFSSSFLLSHIHPVPAYLCLSCLLTRNHGIICSSCASLCHCGHSIIEFGNSLRFFSIT
jgi:hypothetical protein